MKNGYIITIGRQFGSGGHEIGQKIAARLGISFYDKELIRIASRESGLREEFFEKADEKKHFSLFPGFFGMRSNVADEISTNYYLSNEALFRIQSEVMRKLADEGPCLFVGRCADYVMKDRANSLNIFIHADFEERVRRIASRHRITENKAREMIEKTDRSRSGYYNYVSGKNWGAAESYHLCINSSVLGIDETALLLCHVAEVKFSLKA
jgi:cytidylate kinase